MNPLHNSLTLQDFQYNLPEELIAQTPLTERDDSRLLVRTADAIITDRLIKDLDQLLPENAVLVVNNTRVIPSRLFGYANNGAKVEIFILSPNTALASNAWQAIGKPGRKIKHGQVIKFDENTCGTIIRKDSSSMEFTIEFNKDSAEFDEWLEHKGYVPLPPYIKRLDEKPALVSEDRVRYQTIYAQINGSVAAPTAGLHFTDRILKKLSQKNITILPVTLHVGAGTFMPVKSADITQHKMHEEYFMMPQTTQAALLKAKTNQQKIFAVGTTSLRCLESFHLLKGSATGATVGEWHKTNLFIHPSHRQEKYTPWLLDGLITNFHQPGSTLLMLISALLSVDEAQRIYRHAIIERYRFLSYGDACLFWF